MRRIFLVLLSLSSMCFGQQILTVTDVINLSKAQNLALKAYEMNTEVQKADIVTAGLRPNILFNQQSIFLVNQNNLNNLQPDQSLIVSPYGSQLWFQLTKVYQVRGKRQAKIDVKTKELRLSETEVKSYAHNIAYQSTQKWLEIWQDKLELDILIKAHKTIQEMVTINDLRLKNQAITRNDAARTKILFDQYATLIKQAEQKLKSDKLKLRFLTNIADSLDFDIHTDENLFFFKQFPEKHDSLMQIALKERNDLKYVKATKEIHLAKIKLNKANKVANPEFGIVANPQNTQPYLGWYFQMALPTFDRNQGEIQRSQVEYKQAEAEILATISQIEAELNYTFQEYKINKENSENYKAITEQSNEILTTVRYAYLRGGTTIIDYLLAQQSWFDTQKLYYETLFLYRKSYIDLLYASGILSTN
jgi:outer membrane protein, heavy metal efflux system